VYLELLLTVRSFVGCGLGRFPLVLKAPWLCPLGQQASKLRGIPQIHWIVGGKQGIQFFFSHFIFYYSIIVVLGVYCDIYKSDYNILVEFAPSIILALGSKLGVKN
jgi:hypothetical protein